MPIKKHIPNFITLMNLLAGILAIYSVTNDKPGLAGLLIFIAALMDFLDGMLARLLDAKSPIGGELDSLADVVSFGVAPAFIMFYLISQALLSNGMEKVDYLAFVAFVVPLFSALRLAKFNIDESQTTSFKGLPTPATGLLIASLPIIMEMNPLGKPGIYQGVLSNVYFLLVITIACSLLMVSRLPMFALKFKSLSWDDNQIRYVFIIISVTLLIFLQIAAVPLIMLTYILLSVLIWIIKPET